MKYLAINRKPGVLLNWQLILYGTADLSPMAIPQNSETDQQVVVDDSALNEAVENDLISATDYLTNEEQQGLNSEEMQILHNNELG